MKEIVPVPNFFVLLTLLFIGLKLTGHIDWSWLVVLSPMLLPLAVVVVVISILLTIYLVRRE